MRVAALYDIHANIAALEAVLAEVDREDVDVILVGGDVAWGPHPRETVDKLMNLERARFVRGNADREVAEPPPEPQGDFERITLWSAQQLSADQRAWLLELPTSQSLEIDGVGRVLFCHGSPRSDEEPLTPVTTPARSSQALSGVAADLVVCGHTHMQFTRATEAGEILNPGSVGLPYQRPRGAFWALIGPAVDLRRTEYDVEGYARQAEASGCPHVKDVFIQQWLEPPEARDVARQLETAYEQRFV